MAGTETTSSKDIFNIDKSDFSNWYNEIIKTADLVDLRYNVKGFVIYRPWLMRMAKELYSIWEAELERRGHSPTLFPVVIPEENFEKEKNHVQGFSPQVFWVTEAGGGKLDKRLALRPTSETAFYQMYALWIRSYADLPLKLYQSCAVYRYETKATKPLIRGREFLWIEAHDVFADDQAALRQVREDMDISRTVLFEKLGIPIIFFRRPAFDKFAGAVDTYAADALMPDKRAVQLPSTHYLGQGFARAFGLSFEDEEGRKNVPYQTCYGPPISRTLAVLAAIHGDKRGLVLPFAIAPIQVMVIPIVYKGQQAKVMGKCRQLVSRLRRSGLRAEMDDSDKKPGVKFYYWEMKGVPIRAEIGPKDVEEGTVTLVRRDTGGREKLAFSQATRAIRRMGNEILENLRKRATEDLNSHIFEATTMKELAEILACKGGFVKVPLCSRELEGEACAHKISEQTEGQIRGTIFDQDEVPAEKACVACGRPARCVVVVAKAY